MDKWKVVKVSDVCTIRYGKDHKQLSDGEIPVYGSGGIMRYVDKALYNNKSVLIPRKGTLNNLFFTTEPFWTVDTLFYTEIDELQILPEYLYYYLKTLNLSSMNVGTAVPSLTTAVLNEIPIILPSLSEQDQITATLSTLDKKISNNTTINHHLEQIAQTIFKSWFSDYEPTKPFTDFVQVLGGGTPKTGTAEYWNGDIPFFTPKDALGTYTLATEKTLTESGLSNCSSRFYPVNTVFVTARGTVGKLAFAGRPMAMNQSCYALIGTEGFGQHYVYHLAQYVVESLKHKASGAVFDAIVTRDFESELVPSVKVEDARSFEGKVAPIYDAILNNSYEIIQLSELRDTLLPRLMSGQLSVADI